MSLDKFYTLPSYARLLKHRTNELLGLHRPQYRMEPCAGGGAFLEPHDNVVSFDIAPDIEAGRTLHPDQLGLNAGTRGSLDPRFLRVLREEVGLGRNILAIGNPPFGRRSTLALEFLNSYLEVGGVVAFVMPISFRKWSVQRRVREDARLIADWPIPEDAFQLPDGRAYRIRCAFQIWSIRPEELRHPNMRLSCKPATTHPDFVMARWNLIGSREQAFGWDFDFAVRCQGYVNYGEKLNSPFKPSDNAHYMMFKAKNPRILKRLRRINFEKIATSQMVTPGFGKADVVNAYNSLLAA